MQEAAIGFGDREGKIKTNSLSANAIDIDVGQMTPEYEVRLLT
jgi:hypothetical protein